MRFYASLNELLEKAVFCSDLGTAKEYKAKNKLNQMPFSFSEHVAFHISIEKRSKRDLKDSEWAAPIVSFQAGQANDSYMWGFQTDY